MRFAAGLLALVIASPAMAEPLPCGMAARYAMTAAVYRDRGMTLEWAINTAKAEKVGAALYLADEVAILRDVWRHPEINFITMQTRTRIRCERAAEDALAAD